MAVSGTYMKSPVVVRYKTSARARTVKLKILRGKTDDNIDKLLNNKVPGIGENTEILSVSVGYRYIPAEKLTATDKKVIKAVHDENVKAFQN